jgi:hypothetical protein
MLGEDSGMHNAAPNTLSRPVVSLARISDPSGCCAAIDLFIEATVCGRSGCRGMIIDGPIGSGKRQVALAAAAEFGVRITEIEPTSIVSRDELASLLEQVGRSGVLVIHNFDELPERAQIDLNLLVTTGQGLERPNRYSTDAPQGRCGGELEQPRMLIATTNLIRSMPREMVQTLPCFTLRRHRESIRWSLDNCLRDAGAAGDAATLDRLADLLYLAPSDRFGMVAAVLIAQADRCEGRRIDEIVGRRVVEICWGSMPTSEVLSAVQALATERGIEKPDLAALAAELGMPVVLRDEAGRASGRGRDERRRQRNIGDLADAMRPPSGDLRQA